MYKTKELLYTEEHEWIKTGDGVATVGITAFAVEQLGDIVFVELPEKGDEVEKGESMGVVESVKTVSDLFAPVSGEVTEVNPALLQEIDGEDNDDFHPEYVNEEPFGKGWMLKISMSDEGELEDLLTPDKYEEIAQ